MQPAPPSSRRAGRAGLLLALLFGLALLVALGVWWRFRSVARDGTRDGGEVQQPVDPETQRLRELAAAYYAKDSRALALETLRGLVERERPAPRDLIAAAVVELANANPEPARAYLERARKLGDRSAALDYNLARVSFYEFDFETAVRHLREARRKAPDDLPTALLLAQRIEDAADEGDAQVLAEAEGIYREVIALGVDFAGSWYMTALYRLGQMQMRRGEEDEGARHLDEYQRLQARGLKAPQSLDIEYGNFGRLPYPEQHGSRPAGPGALPGFEDAVQVLPQLAGQVGVQACDVDDDCRVDLLTWGPKGLLLAQQRDGFRWEARVLAEGPVDLALAFDPDGHPDKEGALDVVFVRGSAASLLEALRLDPPADAQGPGPVEWRAWKKQLPALPSAPLDLAAVDYDHEGDLDLVLVGEFGVRLWRNDGAGAPQPEGVFTDATAEAGFSTQGRYEWCVIEDLDTDQDVDLLLGGPDGVLLASNERAGRFSDQSGSVSALGGRSSAPLVADLDGDGRPDLWVPDQLLRGMPSGRFEPGPVSIDRPPAPPAATRLQVADLDLDGSLDVFWVDGAVLRGRQSVGLELAKGFELDPRASSAPAEALFADLDGDLAHDLVVLGAEALEIRRGEQAGNAVRLAYRGKKDNRQGIGAVVELRAGLVYRRLFWRGVAQLVGLGASSEVDYVRITWPNGVTQHDLRRATGDRACDLDAADAFQPEGLMGSCPFLYTWNGERYEFVSDVLGITPLGLPMGPGMLVPPDHDEYVLVRGEQLRPKDGFFELQFTEELREVTYLDRIRLDVVDHPAGSEVYPNELFCFPPFPEARIHTVEAPLAPMSATGSDGGDWTAALSAIDGEHALPFELVPGQMLGLATPHYLELEFDREAVRAASKLRLLMTGWFYWTDASVNMAAARDPRYEFVPPILQVPDGEGGWRPTGPPVGFPAGKTKTMVVDVTELLNREDPRLRVFQTLRLYWDSIRLATDADAAPLAQHSLEPVSADLWRRGFSAPLEDGREHQPERFVWEELAEFPRWNPHPGLYTRLGQCLPLLLEIDDRFVIMATGDALTVRFDASALPPPPAGWRRDFLVFLDGWAKDRDPNTHEALFVEPLPFHGMSGYPYGPDERFPDDAAHRAWRREWNTRDAEPWIPFLAPPDAPLAIYVER